MEQVFSVGAEQKLKHFWYELSLGKERESEREREREAKSETRIKRERKGAVQDTE